MTASPNGWVPLEHSQPAYALYKAWWGGKLEHTDVDNALQIIDIDQHIDEGPLGKILLRQEYKTTCAVIESYAPTSPRRGFIVIGQPGIGKTYFLWYLLRYRLSKSQPTIFALGNRVFFFHKTGAYKPSYSIYDSSWNMLGAFRASTPDLIWALIDRPDGTSPPASILEGAFPVQTTSPSPSRFKDWAKEKGAPIFTMNPWEWNEIVTAVSLQDEPRSKNPVDLPRLRAAFEKYGPVARNIYRAYFRDPSLVLYDKATKEAIDAVSSSFQDLCKAVITACSSYCERSDKLVCLYRPYAEIQNNFDDFKCVVGGLSRFVLDEVLKASAFASLDMKRQVCELFASVSHASDTRSWAFESYAHSFLSGVGSFKSATYLLTPIQYAPEKYRYDPISGGTPASSPYQQKARKVRLYHQSDDFCLNPAKEMEYCILAIHNNPGFDSFMVTEDAVYIFRMTTSSEHDVDSKQPNGLGLLKQMTPRGLPWYFVLVVPRTDAQSVTLTLVDVDWAQAVTSFHMMMLDIKLPLFS